METLVIVVVFSSLSLVIALLLFFYLILFLQVSIYKHRLEEITKLRFDSKNINKLYSLSKYSNVEEEEISEWVETIHQHEDFCEAQEENLADLIINLKKIKLFKYLSQSKLTFKAISVYSKKIRGIYDTIQNVLSHEDSARTTLFELQDELKELEKNYLEYHNHFHKYNGIIDAYFQDIRASFVIGFDLIEESDYLKIKSTLLSICSKIENLCHIFPTLKTAIFVYDNWMDAIINKIVAQRIKDLPLNEQAKEINKLEFYRPKLKEAMDDLNYLEVQTVLEDFFSLSYEYISTDLRRQKNTEIYEQYLPQVKQVYNYVNQNYNYVLHLCEEVFKIFPKDNGDDNLYAILNAQSGNLKERYQNIQIKNTKTIIHYQRKNALIVLFLSYAYEFVKDLDNYLKVLINNFEYLALAREQLITLERHLIQMFNWYYEYYENDNNLLILNNLIKWKTVLSTAAVFYQKKLKFVNVEDFHKNISEYKGAIFKQFNAMRKRQQQVKNVEHHLWKLNIKANSFANNAKMLKQADRLIRMFNNKDFGAVIKELNNER